MATPTSRQPRAATAAGSLQDLRAAALRPDGELDSLLLEPLEGQDACAKDMESTMVLRCALPVITHSLAVRAKEVDHDPGHLWSPCWEAFFSVRTWATSLSLLRDAAQQDQIAPDVACAPPPSWCGGAHHATRGRARSRGEQEVLMVPTSCP